MLSKVVSSSIFKVFGMTRPGIEPRSPGPLANTLNPHLILDLSFTSHFCMSLTCIAIKTEIWISFFGFRRVGGHYHPNSQRSLVIVSFSLIQWSHWRETDSQQASWTRWHYVYANIYLDIYIIIMSYCSHGFPWLSLSPPVSIIHRLR